MASSNRHWPSLFKSKPHHHQWQHDINPSSLLSSACQKPPYSSSGCEERTPEPKPRWNPKPEQIRILEGIFNSGMVNPPRDEIRRIRAQLQEYGQVGDANVFYWFQNRKSRSKHKQRHLQSAARQQPRSSTDTASSPSSAGMTIATATMAKTLPTATSSSSSSSERSTGSEKTPPQVSVATLTGLLDASASPTASVNQSYFQAHMELCAEPFFFPAPPTHGCYFPDLAGLVGVQEQPAPGVCSGMLWGDLMGGQEGCNKTSGGDDEAKIKMQLHHHGYGGGVTSTTATSAISNPIIATVASVAAANVATTAATSSTIASPVNEIQGMGGIAGGVGVEAAARSTVFINEVAFEVGTGPLNVREAFGEEAVLLHASGHHVLTDEWGVTLHPLQHGSSYYLV